MSVFSKSPNPFIFIHIPKTAGKSLLREIKKNFSTEVIENDRTINDNYHSTIIDAEEKISNIDEYKKITVIRNPWSRVTSWFFFRKGVLEKSLKEIRKTGTARKLSYENQSDIHQELDSMNKGLGHWLKFYANRPWDYTWFSLSTQQSRWLDNHEFQHIIKFENIDEDVKKIDIFKNFNLTKSNISYNSLIDYRQIYDTETKNFVSKLYEEDIEKFQYQF